MACQRKEKTITGALIKEPALHKQAEQEKTHSDNVLPSERAEVGHVQLTPHGNDDAPSAFLFPENIFITTHRRRWKGRPRHGAEAKVIKPQLSFRQLADVHVRSDLQREQK